MWRQQPAAPMRHACSKALTSSCSIACCLTQTADLPVADIPAQFLLTAQGDPSRVLGLEWGADDYVAKSFEPRELVARILLRERRIATAHSRAIPTRAPRTQARFGGWCSI
jgi:DNA-binding response OmpR family regulator